MSVKFLNGIDVANQRVTSVADPSANTDAATKQYVDNVARGLYWKAPVRVASTTAINLAAPGATIDGVAMTSGDSFLEKDNATGANRGRYIWNGAAVAATRRLDADSGSELAPGTVLLVTEGTVNGDKSFGIISDAAITIGTTSMTWGQIGGGTTYAAGNGLQLSGGTFSVVPIASGGLIVNASGVGIDTGVVARKFSVNIGNGALTTIDITHNFGTKDIVVGLRESATDQIQWTDVFALDNNTARFTFAAAPTSAQYRATVLA